MLLRLDQRGSGPSSPRLCGAASLLIRSLSSIHPNSRRPFHRSVQRPRDHSILFEFSASARSLLRDSSPLRAIPVPKVNQLKIQTTKETETVRVRQLTKSGTKPIQAGCALKTSQTPVDYS